MNISVEDLHNHYLQHHTQEELSHTIINFQDLMTHFKPIALDCSNNNNCKNDQIIDYNAEATFKHDEQFCSSNCSQFFFWEHELGKRTEIPDEDFYNIIEMLCNDLEQRKSKGTKGRKRKNEVTANTIKTGTAEYDNKIYINRENKDTGTENESMNRLNDIPSPIYAPIIPAFRIKNSVAFTIASNENNEIPKSEKQTLTTLENIDIKTFTLSGTNTEENILRHRSLNHTIP